MYTSDFHFPGMVYAVPVCSTVAKGRITRLDTSEAEKMVGVVAILHRENIGKLYRSAPDQTFSAYLDEKRPPLEDDIISYGGQYVALAVAETFEQAQAAAAAVTVIYSEEKPEVSDRLEPEGEMKTGSTRGDSEAAFAIAPVKIDETYVSPKKTRATVYFFFSSSSRMLEDRIGKIWLEKANTCGGFNARRRSHFGLGDGCLLVDCRALPL
jgi:xanthine dehydrogenase YagR molybdenum-binding subunit